MTKPEFGLNLFETIVTIGGILSIDLQRAVAIHQQENEKKESLLMRRRALQGQLAIQLPLLTNDELDHMLAAYPWVTGC